MRAKAERLADRRNHNVNVQVFDLASAVEQQKLRNVSAV
jgi:hypothetical protein